MKSNSFEIEGRIHEIFNEVQVSEKFRRRETILEIPDGSYTQYAKFQFTQDKCNLLDQFKIGDNVKISFNLSGKPFEKNGEKIYFTNLQGWRIESAGAASPVTPQQSDSSSQFTVNQDDSADLPF